MNMRLPAFFAAFLACTSAASAARVCPPLYGVIAVPASLQNLSYFDTPCTPAAAFTAAQVPACTNCPDGVSVMLPVPGGITLACRRQSPQEQLVYTYGYSAVPQHLVNGRCVPDYDDEILGPFSRGEIKRPPVGARPIGLPVGVRPLSPPAGARPLVPAPAAPIARMHPMPPMGPMMGRPPAPAAAAPHPGHP